MAASSTTQIAEGAVPRAFSVLEHLAQAPEPLRLSALALALGLQKSTAHRILATLAELGYVDQVAETGCYVATLKLWEIGTGLILQHPVKRAAAGALQELHRATGETVSLTILSGDDVLYLDKIVSPRPIRFTTRVGSRAPAIHTAGGKAMLAHALDAREIVERSARCSKGEAQSAVDRLLRELADVRVAGYATSSSRPGALSFGGPVMRRDGQAAAALSVSAPLVRLSTKKKAAIVECVLVACSELAERVGSL